MTLQFPSQNTKCPLPPPESIVRHVTCPGQKNMGISGHGTVLNPDLLTPRGPSHSQYASLSLRKSVSILVHWSKEEEKHLAENCLVDSQNHSKRQSQPAELIVQETSHQCWMEIGHSIPAGPQEEMWPPCALRLLWVFKCSIS